MKSDKKILIVGLGNPFKTDDSLGPLIIKKIKTIFFKKIKTIIYSNSIFDILNATSIYTNIIIIDSLKSNLFPIGSIFFLKLKKYISYNNKNFLDSHSIDILTLLTIQKQNFTNKCSVSFLLVEVGDIDTISTTISPELTKIIPNIILAIQKIINPIK